MYSIGIDVGGTNLKAGLVDEQYQLVAAKTMPLSFVTMERMGETLADMALALTAEAGISAGQVSSVGIGFPGPVDNRRGEVIKTVNIPIRHMPVAELFQKKWDIPVYLGNDADCAALGEYYHYEDKDIESLLLVTLGTGIGTGIIYNGRILPSVNGFGGEGGHMVIVCGGESCTCGRRGCWERYASASALVRQTRRAMEENRASAMWAAVGGELERVDGCVAFRAMNTGDAAARAVVEQYLDYLADGLVNLINLFQPEVVALGGGVSHEPEENLLLPLQGRVERLRFDQEAQRHTKLVKARLGNNAGIIGAALLGLR